MIKFKQYLKESLDKPYRFKHKSSSGGRDIYTFNTDKGLDYTVTFERKKSRMRGNRDHIEISFTFGDTSPSETKHTRKADTNDFRAGATVIDIIKDFMYSSEVWNELGIIHIEADYEQRLRIYDKIIRKRIKAVKIVTLKNGSRGGHMIIFDKLIDGPTQRKVLETF